MIRLPAMSAYMTNKSSSPRLGFHPLPLSCFILAVSMAWDGDGDGDEGHEHLLAIDAIDAHQTAVCSRRPGVCLVQQRLCSSQPISLAKHCGFVVSKLLVDMIVGRSQSDEKPAMNRFLAIQCSQQAEQ